MMPAENNSGTEPKKKEANYKLISETRKLVKWGSSETLIMSLPRNWVKKNNLTRDSEVIIIENPDGSLLVNCLKGLDNEKQRFTSTIYFDKKMIEDKDLIDLEITIKYLDGNDVIYIEKKDSKGFDKFPLEFTMELQNVVQSLLGLEITSLLSNKIKIEDIMAIHESNIDTLTKIIANTTIDFFQSLIEIIRNNDLSSSEGLLISKKQVRKYYLRILRELRKGLLIPSSLSKMGLTAQDTVDLAFFITEVNDTSENLEIMLNTLKNKNIIKEVADLILPFMENVKDLFRDAVDSFLFKKKSDAITVIKKVPK